MAKPPDDELILYFYGEHPAPHELTRELAADPELSRRYEALRRELRVLDTLEAPEPRPGLEERMWARVAPSLLRPPRRFGVPTEWLSFAALAAGVVVIALGGFLAGQALHRRSTESEVAASLNALPPEARDRLLIAALADHLDSSQRLLLEVKNGAPSAEEERAWAETLLSANRLYRRAAERAGQRRVAAVLAELEPLLTQLADSPASFDLERAQQRIEDGDLLFKVRITRNNLKELS
jgi:hypothetical protein